jgi:hypothetical protein
VVKREPTCTIIRGEKKERKEKKKTARWFDMEWRDDVGEYTRTLREEHHIIAGRKLNLPLD